MKKVIYIYRWRFGFSIDLYKRLFWSDTCKKNVIIFRFTSDFTG